MREMGSLFLLITLTSIRKQLSLKPLKSRRNDVLPVERGNEILVSSFLYVKVLIKNDDETQRLILWWLLLDFFSFGEGVETQAVFFSII